MNVLKYIKRFNESEEQSTAENDNTELYEFTMVGKNGKITKSVIPCDNWSQANNISIELLKSKSISKVNFQRVNY